ncbi:Flavohemoprotein [compost metagenome]
MSQELLGEWMPGERDVDAYFLGPKGFMAVIKRYLKELGVPQQQSRYEFFGPAAALE